jgi:hypothetical protein
MYQTKPYFSLQGYAVRIYVIQRVSGTWKHRAGVICMHLKLKVTMVIYATVNLAFA